LNAEKKAKQLLGVERVKSIQIDGIFPYQGFDPETQGGILLHPSEQGRRNRDQVPHPSCTQDKTILSLPNKVSD
jgi:hypothetical protein